MKIDIKDLIPEFSNNLKLDYDLRKKNWFNIGGRTKAFYKADSLQELIKFLKKVQFFGFFCDISDFFQKVNFLWKNGSFHDFQIKLKG